MQNVHNRTALALRRMPSDVLCISFRCSADIDAISAQCGWPSRLAAGAVQWSIPPLTSEYVPPPCLPVKITGGTRRRKNMMLKRKKVVCIS